MRRDRAETRVTTRTRSSVGSTGMNVSTANAKRLPGSARTRQSKSVCTRVGRAHQRGDNWDGRGFGRVEAPWQTGGMEVE